MLANYAKPTEHRIHLKHPYKHMCNIMQCHVMNRITPSLHTSCVYTRTYMCIHQVLQLFSATEMHGIEIATYITKQLTTKTYAEDAAAY